MNNHIFPTTTAKYISFIFPTTTNILRKYQLRAC